MAVRTTDELVEGIIEVDSAIVLTPFIAAANTLTNRCCTNLTEDYTDDELVQIETWLAAQFYTVRDMRVERERAGTVEAKFQSKVDLGFFTSHYGQMALLLDYHGGLSTLNEQMKKGGGRTPGVVWLGKTEEEKLADL